jgi:hypothetical protein
MGIESDCQDIVNYVESLRKKKIYFAIPAYSGQVCVYTMNSLISTINMLETAGIQWTVMTVNGDCYIAKARNSLVKMFLKTDATHLFFIDADVGFDPRGVSKLIIRDEDVVLGSYPLKMNTVPQRYPVEPDYGPDGKPIIRNGMFKIKVGPTGFMCIRRKTIEDMTAAYPHLKFMDEDGGEGWNLFHCDIEKYPDGTIKWTGEDIMFCRRLREMGKSIWCVPDIDFTHTGQHTWSGNMHKVGNS